MSVSVSIGGWAGSAVNAMVSDDGRNLVNTPWQLVTRSLPQYPVRWCAAHQAHADGSISLPVYRDFSVFPGICTW
jgi:hypothetical protein